MSFGIAFIVMVLILSIFSWLNMKNDTSKSTTELKDLDGEDTKFIHQLSLYFTFAISSVTNQGFQFTCCVSS